MYHDVIIAGFGGQGVLFMGNLLAQAGMEEGHHVTFMPAYGVEMRGGTANCNVILSSEPIGSPIPDRPLSGILMNEASLVRFQDAIQGKGFLFFNSSLVPAEKVNRPDVECIDVPANDMAKALGSDQVASLVMLGCFVGHSRIVNPESLPRALEEMLPPKAREKFLERNLAALEAGLRFAEAFSDGPPKGSQGIFGGNR
jgi:2-oxoglutarate ferredoxin oxidoreductase subunit gamma